MKSWTQRREQWVKREDDMRTDYEVDYSRIMHSSSFRRLDSKTQIYAMSDSDVSRNRLTHSLETAQIALGIAQRLRAEKDLPEVLQTHVTDTSLVQTVGLIHDIGHPPWGHGGEEALNCAFRDVGGFEGNAQTLRLISKLEDFSEHAGANLTRRVMLGTLKYPKRLSRALERATPPPILTESGLGLIRAADHKPPKCYLDTDQDVVDWLLKELNQSDRARIEVEMTKSVDCTLMDVADDLSYSFADMQDAITMRLITRDQLESDVPHSLWSDYLEYTKQQRGDNLFDDAGGYDALMTNLFSGGLQQQIGRLTGYGMARITIRERPAYNDPLYRHAIQLSTEAEMLVDALKKCILNRIILSPRVQHGRLLGQRMLVSIAEIVRNDPRHQLPERQYDQWLLAEKDDRVICDWLAGATEPYVTKLYKRLFVPDSASVTDRL